MVKGVVFSDLIFICMAVMSHRSGQSWMHVSDDDGVVLVHRNAPRERAVLSKFRESFDLKNEIPLASNMNGIRKYISEKSPEYQSVSEFPPHPSFPFVQWTPATGAAQHSRHGPLPPGSVELPTFYIF